LHEIYYSRLKKKPKAKGLDLKRHIDNILQKLQLAVLYNELKGKINAISNITWEEDR
jgi:hypothetical protein